MKSLAKTPEYILAAIRAGHDFFPCGSSDPEKLTVGDLTDAGFLVKRYDQKGWPRRTCDPSWRNVSGYTIRVDGSPVAPGEFYPKGAA